MAKIRFGGGVSEMRGSENGTTYSRNGSGAYTRNRTSPVQPQTIKQLLVRATFGAIQSAWRNLTSGQRQTFYDQRESYPVVDSLGQVVILSAQQLYSRLNNQLQQVGLAGITSCLPPVEVPAAGLATADFDQTGGSFDVTLGGNVPADFVCAVFATGILSAGVTFDKQQFRYIGNIAAGSATDDFAAEWTALTGVAIASIPAGSNIRVQVKLVSTTTGQAGTIEKMAATITP